MLCAEESKRLCTVFPNKIPCMLSMFVLKGLLQRALFLLVMSGQLRCMPKANISIPNLEQGSEVGPTSSHSLTQGLRAKLSHQGWGPHSSVVFHQPSTETAVSLSSYSTEQMQLSERTEQVK